MRALEGGTADPFANCLAICSELAEEIQKNVLEVPSLSSERSESATKSTVNNLHNYFELSFRSMNFLTYCTGSCSSY
jgi:hypothetical protein